MTLVVSLFTTMVMFASPVSPGKASAIAQLTLGGKKVHSESVNAEAKARIGASGAEAPAFYIYNAADGKGFVIVSGESDMPEVVAYSYDSRFDVDNMHPGLVDFLCYYTEVVNDVRSGDAEVEQMTKARAGKAVVGPLCKAQWGQDKPYNTLCPKIDGVNCPVGCVATAMAQIMYHYRWPKVGEGSFRYASGISGVGVIGSNFYEHEYNWDAMCNTLEANLSNAEASAAVAQLSYDCGISTRMKYGAEGSGTYDDNAMKALYTYFGYKASELDFQRRDCYATINEWTTLVKSYLDNDSPVLYGGLSKNGGGHEFIIDGYDSEDYFHVNWGWDGSSNGYYSIVTLNPKNTSYAFTEEQSMVCGFVPDVEGTDKTPKQWRIYMKEAPSVSRESVALGEKFTFTANDFRNMTTTAYTWVIGTGLYDRYGKFVKLLSSKTSTKNKLQILSYYGYNYYDVSSTMPANLADGYYELRVLFCQDGYSDFIMPDMVGGNVLNKVPVSVENGVAYFNKIPTGIDSMPADGNAVIARRYYTVDGLSIAAPVSGQVVIERMTMSDGTVKSIKRKY